MNCSYLLPIRWTEDDGIEELTAYLRDIAARAHLVIVDGSPPELFERHRARWGFAEHLAPDPDLRCANGKVAGVLTGLRRARHECVVIADDDVRYDDATLDRVCALLEDADLVRPQNVFAPVPWHAAWDTARTLINRSFWRDFPGTLGVRRSTLERAGGYDGDVLFENLQCMRTVRATGGIEAAPLDLYVRRLPPRAPRFWSQRIRQAYDDLALPARMAVELALAPVAIGGALSAGWWAPGVMALVSIALAETGRRRGRGQAVFAARCSLLAPAWVAERAITSWLALGCRVLLGGVRYGDRRIRDAARAVARAQVTEISAPSSPAARGA